MFDGLVHSKQPQKATPMYSSKLPKNYRSFNQHLALGPLITAQNYNTYVQKFLRIELKIVGLRADSGCSTGCAKISACHPHLLRFGCYSGRQSASMSSYSAKRWLERKTIPIAVENSMMAFWRSCTSYVTPLSLEDSVAEKPAVVGYEEKY